MTETYKTPSFMSILVTLFASACGVITIFALATSTSPLAQMIAFVLGVIAFGVVAAIAIYKLRSYQPD